MKISKELVTALRTLSTVNGALVLHAGRKYVMTKPVTNDAYADFQLSEPLEDTLRIYDVRHFLANLAMLGDEANVEVSETGLMTLSNHRLTLNMAGATSGVIDEPKGRVTHGEPTDIHEFPAEELKSLMRLVRHTKTERIELLPFNGRRVIRGWDGHPKHNPNLTFTLDMGEYDGDDNAYQYWILREWLDKLPTDVDFKLGFGHNGLMAWFIAENMRFMFAGAK